MRVVVNVDVSRIADWDSFHDVFSEAFGFPAFYGRNLNAWIDCMTFLDDREAALSAIHVDPGNVVTIQFAAAAEFARRCPDQYAALVECSAFVNWRRLAKNEPPVLALSFYK